MNIVLNTALLLLALGLVTNAYGGGAPLPPLQTLPIGTTFSVDNEDLIVTQALEYEQPIFQEIGTPTIDNKPILDGVGTPTVDTPTLDTSVYLAEEFYWVEPAVTAYEEEHPKLDNGVADNLAATVINVEQNNVELPDEDASGSGTLHCEPPWGNTSDTVCFKYEDHPARCMSTGTARTLSFLVHIIFFGMLLIIAAMGCTVRKRNREVRQLTLEVVAALNRSTERVTLSPVPDDQLMVVPPVYNSGSGSVYKSQHIYSSSVA